MKIRKSFMIGKLAIGLITLLLVISGCTTGASESKLQEEYEKGYQEGISKGYQEGRNEGYQEALDEGRSRGYEDAMLIFYGGFEENTFASNKKYIVEIKEIRPFDENLPPYIDRDDMLMDDPFPKVIHVPKTYIEMIPGDKYEVDDADTVWRTSP